MKELKSETRRKLTKNKIQPNANGNWDAGGKLNENNKGGHMQLATARDNNNNDNREATATTMTKSH